MVKDEYKSHIDDIINSLNEKISREEIEKEFEKFIEYGVPIEQTKQALIKKYGGGIELTRSFAKERTLISDLQPNRSSVKVIAHVIAVNPKEITVRGEKRKIFYGILGDESGTVPFTAWGDFDINKGDVLEITNAYTREWGGIVKLNIGERARIEKVEKDLLPESAFQPKEVKIKDLRSGIGRVKIKAKILELNEKELELDGEKKKVFSGIIADETGKAQFTCWHDFNIKKGDVLKISGGYVKSWKGIPQLVFDATANVEKVEKKEIRVIERERIPLYQLVEKKGGIDVEIEGIVVDISDSSGFVKRCSICNRVLLNDSCSKHGKIDSKNDFRIRLVLDDGTGCVNVVLNKELSEKILGTNIDKMQNMKREDLIKEIENRLFTKRMSISGNALGDRFGTTVIAKDAYFLDIDVEKESENILNEIEGLI